MGPSAACRRVTNARECMEQTGDDQREPKSGPHGGEVREAIFGHTGLSFSSTRRADSRYDISFD